MRLLKDLYRIYSPSGSEKRITNFIKRHIHKNHPTAQLKIDKAGNIYITKGISESYPCVVAHLDQVHSPRSKDFKVVETHDIIFGYSPNRREQQAIGADDKNGIWIALKALESCKELKIALFVQEEVGCIGSQQADMKFFADCRFVIEPDRRGHSDMITSIGWTELCSEEFIQDCNPSKFGYKQTSGAMTDVQMLKERGLGVSCINFSCGYYNPHTSEEFTVKRDLINALNFALYIIGNCKGCYLHQAEDLIQAEDPYLHSDFHFEEYEELVEVATDEIAANPEITPEELFEDYQAHFPSLTIADFAEILSSVNRRDFNF